jgi:transcriptional regulator with XRE-family HTH domain
MDFRQMVKAEFQRRRRTNPRYSLRSFARFLGTDHATLSQILRGKRNLSPTTVRRFGERLGVSPRIIADVCLRQHAEAILRLSRAPSFCTHTRWIAARTGIALDAVNIALYLLIREGELVMRSADRWTFLGDRHG